MRAMEFVIEAAPPGVFHFVSAQPAQSQRSNYYLWRVDLTNGQEYKIRASANAELDDFKNYFIRKWGDSLPGVKVKQVERLHQLDEHAVAEGPTQIVDEIDFSSSLGDLNLSDARIIDAATADGTIGSRKVFLFTSGPNRIYFFASGSKLDALVYLSNDRLLGMKNFSSNSGLIYNLFQYLVTVKKQKITLAAMDKLTSDGIKWIIGQINRPQGFKITDGSGHRIDPKSLYSEWSHAQTTGKPGPSEIIISETVNGKQLRENEERLMPMDIFGATLKEAEKKSSSRLYVPNLLKTYNPAVEESKE